MVARKKVAKSKAKKPTAAKKPPAKKPAAKEPDVPLVPQPHGGALRRGGIKGPGPGRRPSVIREAYAAAFDKRLPMLEKFADDKKLDVADRLKAIDMMGKYGVGVGSAQLDEKSRAQNVQRVVRWQIKQAGVE